ncbi:RNA polymerase subunit sigma-24 [Lentzea guizhouensis]|uniref:RNA polymerase subunit sigma-24 n=1 Tax=Lentzea guizhouensis TaxID=1586287 RepID=A0A1B2I0K7_9PSEU|nr:RNA polymerase sigma-70 factor [Lentzea guizhouensis]ANZ43528.1 RNA polymerase subunit sigma-24 [Lentzea guizhouensis]
MTQLEQAESAFAAARPRLFGIAYRMTGSVADAEDLVQEVWLRWQTADRAAVLNPEAYLATAITRLAINESQTARARRETYVGPWLPEPVDTAADPQLGAEQGAVLELAVLLLLEKLTPTERAAYVLREAFDYPYREISEIVQTTEVAARQLVSRARKHLADSRRTPVAPQRQRELLEAFVAAAQAGDLAGLEKLFAADVVSWSDSNGAVRAAGRPLHGAASLAKIFAAWAPTFWTPRDVSYVEANGQWAIRLQREGEVYGVITVTASEEGIDQVMWLVNPEKLGQFA